MSQAAILQPVFALVAWTFVVLLLIPVARFRAAAKGEVAADDLVLAWTYVGLRVVHSLIHLTYNAVMHRLMAFAVSSFVLAGFWISLFLAMPG
jgi:hypothetical protein